MYNVYVLYNGCIDKIYIGFTENLGKRIKQHNTKFKNSFTSRSVGEWKLVYLEEYKDRKEATRREKELKSFRGREFIRVHLKKII